MSLVHVPRLIQGNRNARNGMVVSALLHRELVAAENHITAYRHRQVYGKSLELGTDVTGATALAGRWRFRTGYGVDRCLVVMLMGQTTAAAGAGSTSNPISSVALTISGGATTTATFAYGTTTASVVDGPDEHSVMAEEIAVAENTVYECLLSNAGAARPLAIMVCELAPTTVGEATSYMNTHSPTGGSPILDADRERLFLGLSNMYRRNGAMNAHWSLFGGASQTRTSATAINLIDNATTGTPTASSQGFFFSPQYHRTQSRTTVPMEFAVYASITGGATGVVRLIDTSGNIYASTNITGASPAWFVTAFNMPESAELFLSPQYASNGVQTLSVAAVSIIETE